MGVTGGRWKSVQVWWGHRGGEWTVLPRMAGCPMVVQERLPVKGDQMSERLRLISWVDKRDGI